MQNLRDTICLGQFYHAAWRLADPYNKQALKAPLFNDRIDKRRDVCCRSKKRGSVVFAA